MNEKHWTTDKPETVDEALELLRFGVISPLDRDEQYAANARTERRMLASAELLEREITRLQERVTSLERQASIDSWTTNPDRTGGQYTPEEILAASGRY